MIKNSLRFLKYAVLVLAAAGLLSACGATVNLDEATAETALTAQWMPQSSTDTVHMDQLALAQRLDLMQAETPKQENGKSLSQTLDEFCARQPGSFSVYLKNVTTGESYTYNADAVYYPASLLKLPYAFWLCSQADAGLLQLDTELPNQLYGQLEGTALQAYDTAETVPARQAIRAMIAHSDNDAVTLLTTEWPGTVETGFQQFLESYGFAYAAACSITPQNGIQGMVSAAEYANVVSAVYSYLETDSPSAAWLKSCMLAADHDILYVPSNVPAAKKYGSWDYAYHDAVIVYARHPYWIVCMTDQGTQEEDFPQEPTQAMQTLGQLVYEYWN